MKSIICIITALSLLFFPAISYAADSPFTIDSTKGAKINLYYYERNPASPEKEKPVLFVHGFNSNGSVWRDEKNNYAKEMTQQGYDVIIIDMRGNPVDTDGDYKVDRPVVGESWGYGVRDLGDDVGAALIYSLDYLNKNLPGRDYKKADVITHSTGALAVTSYSRSQGLISYRDNIDNVIELAPPNNGSTSLVANIKQAAQIIPSVFTQSMTAYEYALELLETKVWIPGGRMESENLRRELMPDSMFMKSMEGLGPRPDITTYIAIGDEDWVVGDWSPVIEGREDIGYEYFIGLDHFSFCNSGLIITALLDKLTNGEKSNFFSRLKPYRNKNITAFLSGPGIDHPDDTFDTVTFARDINISPIGLFKLYLRIGARKNKESLLKYWEALTLFEEAQKETVNNEQDIVDKWGGLLAQKNIVLKACHARASKEYLESPDIAILANGYFNELAKLIIEKAGEPVRIIDHTFSPSIFNEQKVLFIPSGGLAGLSCSSIFKKKLSEFVGIGGTIVVFSQQFGYELNALPGNGLGGYGWQEDSSCHSKAAYIENFHQIFASQQELYPDFKLDGYFTDYPAPATVLLRRTKNLMPAMLMYDYKKGRVIVSSLYSDWGYTNGQASQDEIRLIQDLVRWAKKAQDLAEYTKEKQFSGAVEVYRDFNAIEMILKSPDGAILEKKISSEPVYEPGVAPARTGIYSVDYILYNSSGEAIQPQTEGFYFCFSQPPEGSVSNPDFNFDITSDRETYVSGAEAVLTLHLKNNTPQDALVQCKAKLNHHDIDFTESFIVPAGGITAFDKKITVNATDLMKADFYSGENYFLGHAERGVKVVQPSVETNIAADKMQYTPGQTILIDSTTINNSKTMFELLLVLSIADSGRELYYNTRLVELGEGGTDSWQESFKIPEDAERGMYKIRLDVFSNSRLVGSSSATADIPGPLVYAGVGDILSIEMEKLLYARGEPILANAIINNHGEKIDSAALDIRVLTDVDAGYLTGMVKDGEGMPVRGALVNNVYTNEKGAYELKRLKTGRLTLNITAHGYDRMTEEVEIIAGANSLDLVLASTEYGNFSGTLPDSIGSELSLQPVDSASSESGARNAVVSGQGNFEFRHVPVGIYGLEIQPESITETIQIEKGENVLGSLHSLEEYYSFSKQGAGGQAVNEHSYQEIQETEPNDDFLSADEVDPAANVHGKIYDIGDEDYFKLTVDAPSLLTITVKNVELDFSPYIIVYDIAGKWLGSTASLSGEELGYTIELAKAGTYYLQLKDRYNSFSSQQEYLLNINSISGSDQYEPNSDFDNAKAVDLRKEIYCTMFPDGDEDYFAIDIADKGEFYMRFEDVPYGLRPSVKLYDHSGRLAAQKGGSSGEEITLQAEIEEAGRYYILIRDWYSNFSSMETYSFQAFFVNTLDEYEPNNSREEAVTLESGKDYFATIATKGDNDFYRLSIPDSGRVIINLTDTPPNIRPYIKLYQWTNSSWIDSTAGAAGEDLTMEFNVDKPSNYFMQIQDRYNSESSLSKYRTSFTFIPDDEYLPDSIEVFHQTVQLSAIVKKEELGIEIPGIEDAGKFYLQAALNSSDPQKNSQAIERFYVGDTIPGPVLFSQIEVLCLDNNAIYSAGEKAGFRFKAVNKGTAGGACEIQFRFRDLFNQAWSEFIEAEKESDIQFDFLLPVDLEEGTYEAEYLFGGKQYQASFRVLSVKLEVEASFRENTFTINLTNTGSIANADLFIEVSCGGFKEARDVVLRDKTELIFEIQETDSQDKIYYGVYFSSGKALYLDSFLLDGGEEPRPSLKIVKAECDKDIYMDGDFVNIEWRLVSQGISSARLAADLFYPDSGSIKIIDEYISVTEGMNILEKEIKPDLKIPGLYRIIYRLICGDSVEVQGSIFFDAGEEVRVELYIAGDEYTQGEKIDFTARCFASSEVEGRLKLVVDEKSSETVNINLNGYEDFTFNAKEDEPGEHTAYLSLSYGDKTVNSGREKFKIIKQPEPNHSPVLLTIGEKIVMIGEALEFSIEAADIDGDIITYSVKDLPRGAVFGKRKFFWMPGVDQAGEYFVSFNATDGQKIVTEKVKIIVEGPVILPGKPLADPVSGIAPLEVYFNADSIASANIVKYEWDFDGKGVYDFNSLESGRARFVYTGQGDFSTRLRITHNDGSADTRTVNISVYKNPDAPEVYLAAGPLKALAPCKVYFQGMAICEIDLCKYEWDFNGDGVYDASSTESAEVIKTYGAPGKYTAELKVTNSSGLSGSQKVLIEIEDPAALKAELVISEVQGSAPLDIGLDASIDAKNEIQKYQWDFEEDGVFDYVSLDSPAVSHMYCWPGLYTPILRVTDKNNVSIEAGKELKVGLVNPEIIERGIVNASDTKGRAPLTVKFSFNPDFESEDTAYFWDFDGDGVCDSVTSLPQAEYVYSTAGVYMAEAKLKIKDNFMAAGREAIHVTKGKNDRKNAIAGDNTKLEEAKNALKNSLNKIELSDRTALTLPAGLLEEDDVARINKLEEYQVHEKIEVTDKHNIIPAGEYREYKFDNHKKGFDKEMTLSIPYADEDNDGIVDGRDINELTLDAYWFNEDSQDWEILSDVLVFPQENLVTIKTNHFSLFGIAGEKIETTVDPVSESWSGDNAGGSADCFIATAVFGTPMAQEVKILCKFRDSYLFRTSFGSELVRLYYRFSPPAAKFIQSSPFTKFLIRQHIRLLARLIQVII